MTTGSKPVLVLGGGINGCAIARELLLNGVSVWLVDTADVASGATSGSSRLIHGGLRYLEYGEFDLVKESLAERGRLLRLAPQFVHPLKLIIPAGSRFGGAIGAVGKFFGWKWWPSPLPRAGRGVSLIRAGLALYDLYSNDSQLPRHQVTRTSAGQALGVDRHKYRWLCSYYDGQVTYPERLLLAMLEDARRLAVEQGLDFRVFNYHQASLSGDTVEISRLGENNAHSDRAEVQPAVVVNATGAWVDETLKRLHVPSRRLMGGTKGSHLFTFSPRLRNALAGQGIYAEARDGRPIFITPLADAILIGTTDEPFEGPPENALASGGELQYLLDSVNAIFPDARLTAADVDFHYSAVRPLPYVPTASPAGITRRHSLVKHDNTAVPVYSVVGGKLTTMRSLAELTTAAVMESLNRPLTANSRERTIPGGEDYPADDAALEARVSSLAQKTGLTAAAVTAVWRLFGTRTEAILSDSPAHELLADTPIPKAVVRWSIRHEWAVTLADLVERRLMLLYHQRLTPATLRGLADALVAENALPQARADDAVAAEVERLATRYGKHVA